eukprot:Colp12_sorted_trinity150504_noHs@4287
MAAAGNKPFTLKNELFVLSGPVVYKTFLTTFGEASPDELTNLDVFLQQPKIQRELQEAIAAILYSETIDVPVITENLLIQASQTEWKLAGKFVFFVNQRKLKTSQHRYIFQVQRIVEDQERPVEKPPTQERVRIGVFH